MYNKTPTKGMRDFLPAECAMRQKVLDVILSVYKKFGFSQIETPSVENLDLLCSKQGGDNEKLIYKILKRGEKLEEAKQGDTCDLGLRYDLTVPLSRFYANNRGQLPSVFKAIQTGYVWRAERPQRGRFRQLRQCDIDIIGEDSILAEIELITATSKAVNALGFNDAVVKVNDRRLLFAVARKCGFEEKDFERVFIALDKLDKIGVNGILEEIKEISPENAETLVNFLVVVNASQNRLQCAEELLGSFLDDKVKQSLEGIISVCSRTAKAKVVFDVTLVRGMNYYTGTIYEIALEGFDGAVAGGGRYDDLIGKISGTPASACGFSIGFERIVMLLSERNATFDTQHKTALIIPRDADVDVIESAMQSAEHLRDKTEVCVVRRIKNFTYQLQQLTQDGFDTIYRFEDGQLQKV